MKRPAKNITVPALDGMAVEAIASAVQPAELSEARRNRMRQQIMDRLADEPPELTQTVRGDSVEWMEAWPNVWAKVLRQDPQANLQVVLLRIKPGGIVPAHVHTKEEECIVLDGEIFIGCHPMRQGDLHIAKPGAAHGDITTHRGATVLVRSEIPPDYLQTLLQTNTDR